MVKLSEYLAKSVELGEIVEEYYKIKHGKAGDISITSS